MKKVMSVLKFWLVSVALSSWFYSAQAAELVLPSTPLYLGSNVDANVFFQLDDSGSMDWETLTFDYHYYTNYWRNAGEDLVVSGIWENVTNEVTTTTTTTSGGRGGYRGRRGWGGGGGGGGGGGFGNTTTTTTTTGGDHREFLYMYSEPDRLYTSGSYATAEQHSQSVERDWRGRSVDFNLMYYNPATNYFPWDSSLSNADFNNARSNPDSNRSGYNSKRDLDGFVYEVWIDDHGYGYTRPDGPTDARNGANGEVDLWDSHIKYTLDSSSGTLEEVTYSVPSAETMAALNTNCTLAHAQATVPFSACFGTTASTKTYSSAETNPWGRTLAEEKQNIANWYQYYRKRSYVAKGAIARVMNSSGDFRYGLSIINDYGTLFRQVPAAGVSDYVTHNANLLSDLFKHKWQSRGTPLRKGLELVGKYFDNELSGKTNPIISECQQNFSILLTDGFWNGSSPSVGDANGDGYSNSVADVSKYYYDKDLSNMANEVPTSVIDDNNQQHMVTFTVAFGLRGRIEDSDNDGFPNPFLNDDDDWGNPYAASFYNPSNEQRAEQNAARIDDLWHAAVNSKGWYIQAQSPDAVVNALNAALSDITARVGSSASVATNTGRLNEGTKVFQARYDSDGWGGELIAFKLGLDGEIDPTPVWEAGTMLSSLNYNFGRSIITINSDSGKGVPFRFPSSYKSTDNQTELSVTQATALLTNANFPVNTSDSGEIASNQSFGQDFINYLRGDKSNELIGRGFRVRKSALGDIVDSDPKFVGPPRFRYPTNVSVGGTSVAFEDKPYADYRTANASRTPVIYVGANDGMLHGIRESDGAEILSFVPNTVYKNLADLGKPTYLHKFFVNEAPVIVDAYLDGVMDPEDGTSGAWQSVLVGGLGAGGQAIYALNVSYPDQFSEANADKIVMWEFTDADDADLGYTFGEVQVAKMSNGKWAAVFSNGYNSSNTSSTDSIQGSGRASVFVVDLETGSLIKKIETLSGSIGSPNGLSTPSLVDSDGDFLIDTIYAGDLRGQVWKFDVSSNLPSSWESAYKNNDNKPKPLFTTATDQPITSSIRITQHPEGRDGYMLFFGTGKYLELVDNGTDNATTQAFYGIWDNPANGGPQISNLLQQKILDQYSLDFDTDGDSVDDVFNTVRGISDNEIDYTKQWGWYLNLQPEKVEGQANTKNFGEKQVSQATVRDGRVIFTTVLPSAGACDFGGTSFIMQLDYADGGVLDSAPFDLNGDGVFDRTDSLAGGLQSTVGIVPTINILSGANGEIGVLSGSIGQSDTISIGFQPGAQGRQSWREIR